MLKRTLGVPLFQEQAMQIAITAAKFTPDEADGLRRAMATFRHNGTVHLFRDKFITGMTRRGYDRAFAESCFSQIEGFGEYGFPESHAASFALLVYASAWIKCHYPDVFCAAILNSQPMGFYQPAQLVRDARAARRRGAAVDVNFSEWDCTLEPASDEARHRFAVRLGFRQIQGLREKEIEKPRRRARQRLCLDRAARRDRRRVALHHRAAGRGRCVPLARARPARRALGGAAARHDRHRQGDRRIADAETRFTAGWPRGSRKASRAPLEARARRAQDEAVRCRCLPPHMSDELFPKPAVALPAMPLSEHVVEDYVATGPVAEGASRALLPRAPRRGSAPCATRAPRGEDLPQDAKVTVAGLVLMRQRPGTAKGVVFMTLEDETDIANIIVWPKVFAKNRRTVMTARFLAVRGRLQRAGLVIHVVAEEFRRSHRGIAALVGA